MKTYILDTNILLTDPYAITKFEDNKIVIPLTVIQELDNHKTDVGLIGYNARKAIKILEGASNIEFRESIPDHTWIETNDDKIISVAKKDEIVVSNDCAVRVKCKLKGINSEEYKSVPQISIGELRDGRHEVMVDNEIISEFYEKGLYLNQLDLKDLQIHPNEFILLKDKYENKIQAIGIVKKNRLEKCKYLDEKPSGMIPLNIEQKMAIELMMDENIEIVTLSGAFGVSKTYTQINTALELVDKGLFKKIYVVKAPMPLDKDVMTGFKPNGFMDKMQLPLGSITTNIENSCPSKKGNVKGFDILNGYIMHGIIEVISVEDVLGMSLNPNSIMLIEEFEIMNKDMGLAVLSRLGKNSKIFANGDLKQKSKNKLLPEETALFHTINVFTGYEKAGHLTMKEIVRSGFTKELALRW